MKTLKDFRREAQAIALDPKDKAAIKARIIKEIMGGIPLKSKTARPEGKKTSRKGRQIMLGILLALGVFTGLAGTIVQVGVTSSTLSESAAFLYGLIQLIVALAMLSLTCCIPVRKSQF